MRNTHPKIGYINRRYKLDIGYCDYNDEDDEIAIKVVIPDELLELEENDGLVDYLEWNRLASVRYEVDSDIDYLICNEENSALPQVEQARTMNIPIVTIDEFLQWLESNYHPQEKKIEFTHRIIEII